jgi:hypothetical protein
MAQAMILLNQLLRHFPGPSLAWSSGHLPVLDQSFSRRELAISLLDARAGSPTRRAVFWPQCLLRQGHHSATRKPDFVAHARLFPFSNIRITPGPRRSSITQP